MVHPNIFPKATVRMNVKPNEMKDEYKPDEVKDDVKQVEVKDDINHMILNRVLDRLMSR